MTVVDTSAVVDFLLGAEASPAVTSLMATEGRLAAPDLLAFEVLAVLRRHVRRGTIGAGRGAGAVEDLGDLPLELASTMTLRARAWELRESFTAADALFVALAELLDEPLATKDRALAASARRHAGVEVIELGAP